MKFTKVYRNGTFKTLIAMYSFDRNVPSERNAPWNQIDKIGAEPNGVPIYVLSGQAQLLPLNK